MKNFKLTLLFFALFYCFTFANGQSKTSGFSINPKMGIYNWDGNYWEGFVGGVEFNYFKEGWIFSVDYLNFAEFELFSIEDHFSQSGIMIGRYYGNRLLRMQFQGGIAPIWGTKHENNSDFTGFFTLGLVLKSGFKFIPFRFFSVGLDLQSNFNNKKFAFMPLLSFEIGKLRDKIN
jgi:hypothetical protein